MLKATETSSHTTYALGFEIKYISHYAMQIFNEVIFKSNEHWFSNDNDEPLIIDAGANIGCVTLYMKYHFPKANIICFEPEKTLYSLLRSNIENNKLKGIETHNCALGAEDGQCKLFSSKDIHLSGGLGNSIKKDWGIQESLNSYDCSGLVSVRRLSKFINKKVDYLKIDVERAEIDVLTEIQSKLDLVKQIHIEVHSLAKSQKQDVDRIIAILENHGFHCELEHLAPSLPPWTKKWAKNANTQIIFIIFFISPPNLFLKIY